MAIFKIQQGHKDIGILASRTQEIKKLICIFQVLCQQRDMYGASFPLWCSFKIRLCTYQILPSFLNSGQVGQRDLSLSLMRYDHRDRQGLYKSSSSSSS